MIDRSSIEEIVLNCGKNQKTVVSIKSSYGMIYVDVRKWNPRWNMPDQMIPKSGVMFKLSQWPEIIKAVEEMIVRCNQSQVKEYSATYRAGINQPEDSPTRHIVFKDGDGPIDTLYKEARSA